MSSLLLTALSQSQIRIHSKDDGLKAMDTRPPPQIMNFVKMIEERLNMKGKGKISSEIDKIDQSWGLSDDRISKMSRIMKVEDTVLGASSRGKEISGGASLSINQKRFQFYLKKNQHAWIKPALVEIKSLKGSVTAEKNRVLRLRRIKSVNQELHRHNRENKQQIWDASMQGKFAHLEPHNISLSYTAEKKPEENRAKSTDRWLPNGRITTDRSIRVSSLSPDDSHTIDKEIRRAMAETKKSSFYHKKENSPNSFHYGITVSREDIQHE